MLISYQWGSVRGIHKFKFLSKCPSSQTLRCVWNLQIPKQAYCDCRKESKTCFFSFFFSIWFFFFSCNLFFLLPFYFFSCNFSKFRGKIVSFFRFFISTHTVTFISVTFFSRLLLFFLLPFFQLLFFLTTCTLQGVNELTQVTDSFLMCFGLIYIPQNL